MFKGKALVSLLLVLALVFSLTAAVAAIPPIDTEEMILPTTLNPNEYGTPPDGVEVFLYNGSAMNLSAEIDTSSCIADRLYVYDTAADSVTEVCSQTVSVYTATKDALFYITEEQILYKSDYAGQDQERLYICQQGALKNLDSYLTVLYFIENDSQVVLLDAVTGQAQVVLELEDLSWVHFLSETEMVAVTAAEAYFLYDFATKEMTQISSIQASNRITQSVLQWSNADEAEGPDASLMSVYNNTMDTQENDITFPLAEYPATVADNGDAYDNYYSEPLSWFHENGQEGCLTNNANCIVYGGSAECVGFARYAHDRYIHQVDWSLGYNEWPAARHA